MQAAVKIVHKNPTKLSSFLFITVFRWEKYTTRHNNNKAGTFRLISYQGLSLSHTSFSNVVYQPVFLAAASLAGSDVSPTISV